MPRLHTNPPSPTPSDAGDVQSFIDRWGAARRQWTCSSSNSHSHCLARRSPSWRAKKSVKRI